MLNRRSVKVSWHSANNQASAQSRVGGPSGCLTMPAVDSLSSDMAAKAHIDAVNRNYVLEPRLGEELVLPGGALWHSISSNLSTC